MITMLRQRTRHFWFDTFTCAREHSYWQDTALYATLQHALSTYYYI